MMGARIALSLAVLGTLGCQAELIEPFYWESFDMLCDGTPCGWERSTGTADQATWVETVHPGEHALRLTGAVTVRTQPESEATTSRGNMFMQLAVRCDPGSSLSLDVVVNDTTGSHTLSQPSVFANDAWTDTSFCLSDPFDGGACFSPFNARIVAIVFTKTGTASCEIADIVIDG